MGFRTTGSFFVVSVFKISSAQSPAILKHETNALRVRCSLANDELWNCLVLGIHYVVASEWISFKREAIASHAREHLVWPSEREMRRRIWLFLSIIFYFLLFVSNIALLIRSSLFRWCSAPSLWWVLHSCYLFYKKFPSAAINVKAYTAKNAIRQRNYDKMRDMPSNGCTLCHDVKLEGHLFFLTNTYKRERVTCFLVPCVCSFLHLLYTLILEYLTIFV